MYEWMIYIFTKGEFKAPLRQNLTDYYLITTCMSILIIEYMKYFPDSLYVNPQVMPWREGIDEDIIVTIGK